MAEFLEKRPERLIHTLVIHCAATPPSMDVGVQVITGWHLQRGFKDIGYHAVIRRNGVVENARNVERIGAHVQGHNEHTIGVCLVGGVKQENTRIPENNFTKEQFDALELIVKKFKKHYPKGVVCGHNDLDKKKACPSFSVRAWLKEKGI